MENYQPIHTQYSDNLTNHSLVFNQSELTIVIYQPITAQYSRRYALEPPDLKRPRLLHGVLVMKSDGSLTLEDPDSVMSQFGLKQHTVRSVSTILDTYNLIHTIRHMNKISRSRDS